MTPLELAKDIYNRQNRNGVANMSKKQVSFLGLLCEKNAGSQSFRPGSVWREGRNFYIAGDCFEIYRFHVRFNQSGVLDIDDYHVPETEEKKARMMKELEKISKNK